MARRGFRASAKPGLPFRAERRCAAPRSRPPRLYGSNGEQYRVLPSRSPRYNKQTHRTFLRPDTGKCLHYYFYFIDAELGLIYLRVPTWCPFRLQFYCNGHSWLARQLTAAGIGFTLADNAFLRIDDWQRAQTLANGLSPDDLHRILDRYAQQCCPVDLVAALSAPEDQP
jgi:hypothetical protein